MRCFVGQFVFDSLILNKEKLCFSKQICFWDWLCSTPTPKVAVLTVSDFTAARFCRQLYWNCTRDFYSWMPEQNCNIKTESTFSQYWYHRMYLRIYQISFFLQFFFTYSYYLCEISTALLYFQVYYSCYIFTKIHYLLRIHNKIHYLYEGGGWMRSKTSPGRGTGSGAGAKGPCILEEKNIF